MTEFRKYRKKPVVIEAMQFTGDHGAIEDWACALIESGRAAKHPDAPGGAAFWGDYAGLYIDTLEGRMHAAPGDYVICGLAGEFYPCKPDVFEATYEAVSDEH